MSHDSRQGGSKTVLRSGAPTLVLAALATALLACSEPEASTAVEVTAPYDSFASIPAAAVSGTLRGAPFTVAEARYIVDRRPGYERVDVLLFSSPPATACGPVADHTAVWLRRAGSAPIEPGELRIAPLGDSKWEVHYQVLDGEHWIGNGDAAALLSLKPVREDHAMPGELAVCFDDGAGSCVSGQFLAHYCPIGIDMPIRGADSLEHIPPGKAPPPHSAPFSSAAPSTAAPPAPGVTAAPRP